VVEVESLVGCAPRLFGVSTILFTARLNTELLSHLGPFLCVRVSFPSVLAYGDSWKDCAMTAALTVRSPGASNRERELFKSLHPNQACKYDDPPLTLLL
jgi:hypothetical protein